MFKVKLWIHLSFSSDDQYLYPSDIHQTPLWLKKCSICIEIHLKFPYIFQENFAIHILLGLSISQNTFREPVVQELNKASLHRCRTVHPDKNHTLLLLAAAISTTTNHAVDFLF